MAIYYGQASSGKWLFASKDPNHRSPSRPESPAFDRVTNTQQKAMLNSIRRLKLGGEPRPMTLLVPTRKFVPKG
jgi:hypothetical protein